LEVGFQTFQCKAERKAMGNEAARSVDGRPVTLGARRVAHTNLGWPIQSRFLRLSGAAMPTAIALLRLGERRFPVRTVKTLCVRNL
jgi:hypothetical protein